MTVRDLVSAYVLADATVASLIGTRLYPDMLPQKVTYLAVKVTFVGNVRQKVLKGPAPGARLHLEFYVYSAPASGVGSRVVADQVGAAIRRRIGGVNVTLQDTTTSPATDVFVQIEEDLEGSGAVAEINGGLSDHSADYFVGYRTQGGTY